MSNFLSRTFKGDISVWFIFGALCIISLIEMFSASSFLVSSSGSIQGPIMRHFLFMLVGVCLILVIQVVKFPWIRFAGYAGLALSLVLLVYTLLFGVEHQGSSRFMSVAGYQFQPSEVAKISLVIVVADQIERMQNKSYREKYFWIVMAVVGATCFLIFLENFSTAALLFGTVMVMMFIGEVNVRKLFLVFGAVVGVVALILAVASIIPEEVYRESDNKILALFDRAYTWVARFKNFFAGEGDAKYIITDSNRQIANAQIAIARGGFLPGLPGSSIQRDFLSEAFSDFIFVIIVEEGGFFVGVLVILLYLLLLYRAYRVAQKSRTLFCAILVIGISLLIVIQALMHVWVSVDLMPVTGQPLPIISRGGTSMLVTCLYFGIFINVTRNILAGNEEPVAVGMSENHERTTGISAERQSSGYDGRTDAGMAGTPDDMMITVEKVSPDADRIVESDTE